MSAAVHFASLHVRPPTLSEAIEHSKQMLCSDGSVETVIYGDPPISVHQSDSLAALMNKLVSAKVHRAYVTDKSNNLLGVVTLRDAISCFVVEPPNYFGDYFEGYLPQVQPVASEPAWIS